MKLSEAQAVRDETIDEIVASLIETQAQIRGLREAEYLLQQTILEAMETEGSERLRTDAGIVTLTRSVSYDISILAHLREITDPADLVGIYTPEHEEVKRVPEAWNMAKGRKLLKHSSEHAALIEDAKIYGSPRIKIVEKEDKRGS